MIRPVGRLNFERALRARTVSEEHCVVQQSSSEYPDPSATAAGLDSTVKTVKIGTTVVDSTAAATTTSLSTELSVSEWLEGIGIGDERLLKRATEMYDGKLPWLLEEDLEQDEAAAEIWEHLGLDLSDDAGEEEEVFSEEEEEGGAADDTFGGTSMDQHSTTMRGAAPAQRSIPAPMLQKYLAMSRRADQLRGGGKNPERPRWERKAMRSIRRAEEATARKQALFGASGGVLGVGQVGGVTWSPAGTLASVVVGASARRGANEHLPFGPAGSVPGRGRIRVGDERYNQRMIIWHAVHQLRERGIVAESRRIRLERAVSEAEQRRKEAAEAEQESSLRGADTVKPKVGQSYARNGKIETNPLKEFLETVDPRLVGGDLVFLIGDGGG